MEEKRIHLRELIHLPIARGKDPHIKDNFYKHVVGTTVKRDEFGIFAEFDRVMILRDIPPELTERINEVRLIIDEVLQSDLSRDEQYRRFRELRKKYLDDHNMSSL